MWKSSQKWSAQRSASLLAKPFGVRSIAWLDRFRMLLGVNKQPADDAEGKEKRDFAPANLLEAIRKWMDEEQQKPQNGEPADCEGPRDGCAARATPQTDREREKHDSKNDVCHRCTDPVTAPMVWLQPHQDPALAKDVPCTDRRVQPEPADADEKTANSGHDESEDAHLRSNDNKMSDGGRGSASLRVHPS
jgi:hypothetical protein